MEAETMSCLLSGASILTSGVGRASLAVFFCLRLGALAIGAKTTWRDEERDFICNSSREICRSGCLDAFSPVSPFNLFLLQLVVLFTHALALSHYTRRDSSAKARWDPFRNRVGQIRLHFLFLLAKAVLECTFVITFSRLYGSLLWPSAVTCELDLCEEHVACLIHGASAKNVFNLFMLVAAASCVLVCLVEMGASLKEMHRVTWLQAKSLTAQKAKV